MKKRSPRLAALGALVLATAPAASATLAAGESPVPARTAVERALPLIEAGSRGSARERQCFTCHNQGLPILVFLEARSLGFQVDAANLQAQVDHTARHLRRGVASYRRGIGQGGKADTAGMALWALEQSAYPPDETTNAVVHFLLEWNADTPHWAPQSNRPPSEGSLFTSTYLALRGLDAFGRDSDRPRIDTRRTNALAWLLDTPPEETEDAVFRLRALDRLDAPGDALARAAETLLALQQENGGWAQLPDLDPDAYATGSALVALHDTGQLTAESPRYRRGIGFLLESQLDDGSWYVASRSKPIQRFYESGFPHGEDQFIASSATCWSVLALLRTLAAPAPAPPPDKSVPEPASTNP